MGRVSQNQVLATDKYGKEKVHLKALQLFLCKDQNQSVSISHVETANNPKEAHISLQKHAIERPI